MNPFRLDDTHVVITGAAGGIGMAAARIAATLGARLTLADRLSPADVVDELADVGFDSTAHSLDVADRDAVQAFAEGCGPVDALIDCAAICPFDDWEADDWDAVRDEVFSVNLGGPINLCRAFMPGMMARGSGRIALVGSIAGRIGGVKASPHYVMSKGGVHSFVRWAAKRGASRGVTVNAVAPGVVETPMTQNQAFDYTQMPMGRKASAEEIAGPLVFLISSAASYVNGAVLDVNSGMHFA
jgi:NAD(P)-dependent dehydrogenase (short-subunit alcohol dehydrogenase family)